MSSLLAIKLTKTNKNSASLMFDADNISAGSYTIVYQVIVNNYSMGARWNNCFVKFVLLRSAHTKGLVARTSRRDLLRKPVP